MFPNGIRTASLGLKVMGRWWLKLNPGGGHLESWRDGEQNCISSSEKYRYGKNSTLNLIQLRLNKCTSKYGVCNLTAPNGTLRIGYKEIIWLVGWLLVFCLFNGTTTPKEIFYAEMRFICKWTIIITVLYCMIFHLKNIFEWKMNAPTHTHTHTHTHIYI